MQNSFPLRIISRRDSAHEDAFLSRYKALSEHALKLTRGNRDVAGDLLQDTFVYFTEAKPALDEIENLDAYLYSVLRHLHFASLRKGMRDPIGELAAIDYESAELTLRAAPVFNRLYVCDQLARACELAVARKDESRPHCLLLLRFFHGYFLDELVRVAGNSDNTIRKWLREAQSEVRAAQQGQSQERPQKDGWSRQLVLYDRPEEFLRSLRQLLLNSAQSPCPSRDEIRAQYSALSPNEIKTELLSHLAVCGKCLDRVNNILQIPLLANRHVGDINDRGRRPKNGPGPGAGVSGDRFDLSSARRRRDTKIHHEPAKLIVRINGDERAVYDLGQESHHFVLKLSTQEDVHLVEVVSEQDVSLLAFVVDDSRTQKPLEWRRVLEMTNGRVLEATLRYGETWPSVEVVYHDPSQSRAAAKSDNPLSSNAALLRGPVLDQGTEQVNVIGAAPADFPDRQTNRAVTASPRTTVTDLPKQARRWFTRIPLPNMNPLLAGAMLFALCSVVCFFLWTKSGPRISARTLLNRAEQSDVAVAKPGIPGVIYQKVRFTSAGHSFERAIYRDPENKRKPRHHQLNPDDQKIKDRLDLAGVNWDEPLSAANYSAWHDGLPVRHDAVTRTGKNLLTLTTSTGSNGPVVQESLTVRESDFHPIERTVELRGEGTVEIAELNYDVMPWGAVNQDWFEPLSGRAVTDAPGILPALAVHVPRVLSNLELDEAELEARIALNQLHADAGEPIHVGRSSSGIEVKGVVDTDVRKQQLVSRLSQLPHVQSSILSVEELGNRPPSGSLYSPSEPIHVYSVEAQVSPLEQYLRETKRSEDQLSTVSQSLLDGSLKIQQAEAHFSELQPRFSGANQLPSDLQKQLATLAHTYLGTVEAGLQSNLHVLLSLGLDDASPSAVLPESSSPEGDVEQQIRHYQELCRELITGGGRQPRSAAAITNDLIKTSARIRLHLTQMSASIPQTEN